MTERSTIDDKLRFKGPPPELCFEHRISGVIFVSVVVKPTHLLTILAMVMIVNFVMVPTQARAADGIINSVSFDKIPVGAGMEIRSFDDSDQNVILERDFAAAVTGAGFKTSANGVLILSFETRDEIGTWSQSDGRYIFSFETSGGRGGGENTEARLNVFNSASGGLLNKGQGATSINKPSSYRIDATIEDRASGKTLWQGWAVADLLGADGFDLTRRMVPKLVQSIGKTIRQEPFSIY